MEIENVRKKLTDQRAILSDNSEYQQLLSDLESRKSELYNQSEKVKNIEQQLADIEGDVYASNQDYQFAKADLDAAKYALEELISNWKGSKLEEGESIVRISAVGSGMPFTKGTAGKIFRALANQKINIEMIATSEIRTTCIISEKYGEKALNEIHSCFKLGKNES